MLKLNQLREMPEADKGRFVLAISIIIFLIVVSIWAATYSFSGKPSYSSGDETSKPFRVVEGIINDAISGISGGPE